MNINESCLLNFLLNPEEINIMTGIFEQTIKEIENSFQQSKDMQVKSA